MTHMCVPDKTRNKNAIQYNKKKNDNNNGKHNSLTLLVSLKIFVPKQSANSKLEWNKAWTTGMIGMTGKTGVTKMTGITGTTFKG